MAYTCPFDDVTAQVALEELKEDPAVRQGEVDALREWTKQQPNINCPSEDRFLLAFLRASKFRQTEARKLLESYTSRRAKHTKWFSSLDPNEPAIQAVISDGAFIVLPQRDSKRRRIIIIRPGALDTSGKSYKPDDIFRAGACVQDYLAWDEVTQVHGIVFVCDLTGYGPKNHNFAPMEDRRDFLQSWQKQYPGRVQAIHMYNTEELGAKLLGFLKLAMATKVQNRIHQHSDKLGGLHEHIPLEVLPVEYLPADYSGPNAGTCTQLADQLKQDMVQADVSNRIKLYSA